MTDETPSTTRRAALKTAAAAVGLTPFLSGNATADAQPTVSKNPTDAESPTEAIVSLATTPLEQVDADSFSALSQIQLREAVLKSQQPTVTRLSEMAGVAVNQQFWIGNAVFVSLNPTQVDLEADIASLPDVDAVYENTTYSPPEPVETTPHQIQPDQNHQTTYGLEQIDAPAARDEFGTDGSGATIGVVDTGISPDHPAHASFDPANFTEFTLTAEQVDTDPRDPDDHGTHVSGTAVGDRAADPSGTEQEIGVAPNAELLSAKVFSTFDGQTSATTAQVVAGIEWAVENGADVINQSLGSSVSQSSVYDDFYLQVIRDTLAAGVIPVASAGNNGQGLTSSPGNVRESFSIGATNESYEITEFSSGEQVYSDDAWGSDTPDTYPTFYTVPDVSAPGAGVLSSVPGGAYAEFSGTSMSAPHVSGTAGLVIAALTDVSADAAIAAIEHSAVHPGGPSAEDTRYGLGGIDALGAIATAGDGGTVTGTVEVEGQATGLQSGNTVEIGFTNVDASAWEVTEVAGDASRDDVVVSGGENPELALVEGVTYTFTNLPGSAHPLAIRDADDNRLLTQAGTGEFEDDPDVGWTDTGEAVTFTLTADLASATAGYICTIHSAMAGPIVTSQPTTPDTSTAAGFEVTSDFGTRAFTGPDGAYELQIGAGDHQVTFDRFGLTTKSVPVSVNTNGTATANATLALELAVQLLSPAVPPTGQSQPAEITRGESFDILVEVANLETLTVEYGPETTGFEPADVTLSIEPLETSFGIGESVDVDGLTSQVPLTVTLEPVGEIAAYASDGTVSSDGLRSAIDDWRNGAINASVLREVIDAWRTGETVNTGGTSGVLDLEHTFAGLGEETTVTTGPTQVIDGDPATFEIVDATLPEVSGGPDDTDDNPDTITVSATIENTGDAQGTQDIIYEVVGVSFPTTETIPAGETIEFSTTVSGLVAAGFGGTETQHRIVTQADSVAGPLTIPAPEQSSSGEFLVADLQAPDSVTEGDLLEVTATLENTRPEEFSSLVEYFFDDRASESDTLITPDFRAVEIAAESQREVVFSVETDGLLPGTYTHGVRTATDEVSVETTITGSSE